MSKITIESELLHIDLLRTNSSKLIWFILVRDADENGMVQTSANSIAKEIGVNEKTVRNALKSFCEGGLIEIASPICSPKYSPQKVRYAGKVVKLRFIDVCSTKKNRAVRKKSEINSEINSEIKPPVQTCIPPPFVAPEFREVWQMWIEYRKEINNKYKSEKSEKIGYQQMVKKAGGNPEVARQMVEESIANGYKGMFSPKNNNYDNKTTTQTTTLADRYAARRGTPAIPHTPDDYEGAF